MKLLSFFFIVQAVACDRDEVLCRCLLLFALALNPSLPILHHCKRLSNVQQTRTQKKKKKKNDEKQHEKQQQQQLKPATLARGA